MVYAGGATDGLYTYGEFRGMIMSYELLADEW